MGGSINPLLFSIHASHPPAALCPLPSSCPVLEQHAQQLYRHVYLGCKEDDNVHKNFELLYTSLALITIELANEEVVTDLIRLAIALQVPQRWGRKARLVGWGRACLGGDEGRRGISAEEK